MLILIAFQALLLILIVSFTTSATRFPLIHRDNHNLPSSSHHHNHRSYFEARMKRDAMRVASRLLAGDLKTDLQYLGEYLAVVGVGTPPQTQNLMIDTGSDGSWVQCQPCGRHCYPQLDPVFDPKKSTSFVDVGCNDLNCYKVEQPTIRGCDKSRNRCTYEYYYGDASKTYGTLAIENITIGDTTIPNILIGCSHKNRGLLTKDQADGILGLGSGALSVVSQSGGLIGGMFSYCLGDSTNAGWLEFGRTNVPRDNIKWATLIHNIKYPSFYYIDLVGLSVGGEVLNIPGDTFQLNNKTGEGGVILDTGTVVTQLPKVAYEALRDMFKEKMVNYKTVHGVGGLDTCYNLDDLSISLVPTVSYNFLTQEFNPAANVHITLDVSNVLMKVEDYTYCLAFVKSTYSNLGVIGNMHQQGIQITIDAVGGYVGFGSGPC